MSDSRKTGVYLAIVFAVSYAAEFFILLQGNLVSLAIAGVGCLAAIRPPAAAPIAGRGDEAGHAGALGSGA